MDIEMMGAATLAGALFTAAGGFAVTVWGKPAERMKHQERLQEIEARAAEAAVAALNSRAAALDERLDQLQESGRTQAAKLALLEATNGALNDKINQLKSRVSQLEAQALADATTIADLQLQLEQARGELATAQASLEEWAARCGACPQNLSPQPTAKAAKTKTKPASKKGKR